MLWNTETWQKYDNTALVLQKVEDSENQCVDFKIVNFLRDQQNGYTIFPYLFVPLG